MMGAFVIFLAAVYLLLVFSWILKDPDIEKGFGSRTCRMLLLLYMKADLAVAWGLEYAKLTVERLCRAYHVPAAGAQRLSDKRERLREYRCRMRLDGQAYRRRERYNRKIPG